MGGKGKKKSKGKKQAPDAAAEEEAENGEGNGSAKKGKAKVGSKQCLKTKAQNLKKILIEGKERKSRKSWQVSGRYFQRGSDGECLLCLS